MRKFLFVLMCVLLCSLCVWAGDLDTLYQKLPGKTFCFAATSGTDNFKADFDGSIMGQIAADPQVKTFFKQLMESLSKIEDFQEITGPGADYEAFVIELLTRPTLIAMVPLTEDYNDDPAGILLRESITPGSAFDKVFQETLDKALGKQVVQKSIEGVQAYVPADPNMAGVFYAVSTSDYFMMAFNDDEYAMLKHLNTNPYDAVIANKVSDVPSTTTDALVAYVDCDMFMDIVRQESVNDKEAQQVMSVFEKLGLAQMQYYCMKAGFSGANMVMDGVLKTPTGDGIFNIVDTVDKGLFDYADSKAIQAGAMFFDMMLLYDMILENMDMCDIDDDVEQQIAEVEKMIGVKIQDELLDSLEGTFMGYLLPAYSSPELLAPGYVITARLDDVDQFKKCMTSLEAYVKSIVPAGQLQITSQVTEDDKVVHIWAISFAAMMQVIPAWAIEDDMLVIATHPNIVKKVVQRIDTGEGESLVSRPEFAGALGMIPDDTFAMNLTDSKAQARQLMSMLQQYWPMLNMGLASEGIQLPIMLPSIEKYIEQMEPGYSYIQKTPDRIAFHYEGTGLEATSGGVAGGAAGLAILMPALSRTKKVAQRVVCSTNLKGLGTALMVYSFDYDDMLPSENWCDVLIEEVDVSPKSFVCPQSDAIEGECSYAMNENVVGKNMGKFPADVVLVFETDKGREDGPRNASIKTRKHYGFLGNYYDEDTMVYKGRFNQTGGSEDVVCHHNNSGQQGCNIMFADGHVEFVTKDRIADLKWTME